MKRYAYFLLMVVLFTLAACGGAKKAAKNPDLASVPGIQSNEPYDASLVGSAVNKPPAPATTGCTASDADAAAMSAEVIRLVNVERAKAGLGALTSQAQLTQAAQGHALDEGCNFFMSHDGSDGSTALDRIVRAGYVYSWWGENVAAGYSTAQDVMTAWMDSPSHRDNILSPNFTEIGIGYVYNPNDTKNSWYSYWAMSLGAPQ
jgi:uncharacterized protein YkwD